MSISERASLEETGPQHGASQPPGSKALTFLIVTAFLNSLGMMIINPVLPFIARQYAHDANSLATIVAWLATIYALCQFIAAPVLGLLSDRFGRRPLLLICLLGSALGYIMFGFAGALWVLFLSRIIDGLTGGNFSILAAYIADLTKPEERSKFFGMFGAASGVGFIIGPALGGFMAHFGYSAPVFLAAAITIANIVLGFFYLPESLHKEQRTAGNKLSDLNPLKQLRGVLAIPHLRWLLLATFLFCLPFSVIQSNSSVLIIDSLGWNADRIGLVFLFVGGADIVMQGFLAGKLLPLLGEIKMTTVGLVCEIAGYTLIGAVALTHSAVILLAGIALYAIGTGLVEPASRGLVSQSVGSREQGVVQGGSQSLQSLTLIIGPLLGGFLYTQYGHAIPYWAGAAVVGLSIVATLLAIPSLKAYQHKEVAPQ